MTDGILKQTFNTTTVAIIVLWVASSVGAYYMARSADKDEINELKTSIVALDQENARQEADIIGLKGQLDKLGGPLLIYRMDEFEETLDKVNEKTDRIYNVVRNWVD